MKWLLIYTHAYDSALSHISSLRRNFNVDRNDISKRIEHLNDVLIFVEKRIKLIEL
jgi:hypothetical protein